MADIIYDVHVQVVGRGVEHLGEGLPCQEGHAAPVHPRKVGSSCHTVKVVLTFLNKDNCMFVCVKAEFLKKKTVLIYI